MENIKEIARLAGIDIINAVPTSDILTQATATYVLEHRLYEFQRDLDKPHLEDMVKSQDQGTFPPLGMVVFCLDLETGQEHLLDGFHRCTMVKTTGINLLIIRSFVVVESRADKRALHSLLDQGGRERSVGDMLRWVGGPSDELSKGARRTIESATAGIVRGFTTPHYKRQGERILAREHALVLQRYMPMYSKYLGVIKGAPRHISGRMRSGVITGPALVMLESDERTALKFIGAVVAGEGKRGDPEWLAHNVLAKPNAVSPGRALETVQRFVLCYNSYRIPEARETFRRLGADIVIAIDGTDYSIGG